MLNHICALQSSIRLSLIVFFIFCLTACATVPGTGRSQLSLVSDKELAVAANSQYKALLDKSTISKDTQNTIILNKVGGKISQAAEAYLEEHGLSKDIATYTWEFTLIESEEINAFCMPGGKIAFYTGILPYCQGEDGIAAIMGHEVGHAIAKHSKERASQEALSSLGALILYAGIIASEAGETTASAATDLYTTGINLAVLLPYSRTHESEADRIGLSLMAMAGYDPQHTVDFWERMAKNPEKNDGPNFLSTHPADHQRIADIQKFLPEALARYKPTDKQEKEKQNEKTNNTELKSNGKQDKEAVK